MVYPHPVTDRLNLGELLRRAMLPAACIAVIGYFAFHAVSGPTGVLAWRDYRAEHAAVAQQAERTAATKAALSQQVALLDPAHVDPDLADELVRRNLGVVRPDEVVVDLPQ